MSLTAQPADWTRADWLAWRRGGIGASDVAALLGLSRFSSPLALYFDKLGELPETEPNEAMLWGQLLEEPIAREFEARTGLHAIGAQTLAVHDEHPHRRATLDNLVADSLYPFGLIPKRELLLGSLQIKTARAFGWDDGVPVEYAVQVQWELAVTGLERAWLAVLFAGQRLEIFELERDDRAIAALERVVDRFWTEHVLARREPAADGSAATSSALKAVYPKSTDDVIELDGEAIDAAFALAAAKERAKTAGAEVDRLENIVKTALGEHATGGIRRSGGDIEPLVSWKTESAGDRIDAAALRAAHPRIGARFSKASTRRVLRLSKTAKQGAQA